MLQDNISNFSREGEEVGVGQGRTICGNIVLRVGSGPSTGNMDRRVPNIKNTIATHAIGTENLSPV